MPGLLQDATVTDAQRRANDTHRPVIVLAVLGVLALHAYLFTPVSPLLGIPRPQDLLAHVVPLPELVFEDHGLVDAPLSFSLTERTPPTSPKPLLFYLMAAGAFLCAYFLPLPAKRPSVVVWSVCAILALYGPRAAAGLLFAHVVVYLTLHTRRVGLPVLSLAPGVLFYLSFARGPLRPAVDLVWFALAAGGGVLIYRYVFLTLLALPRIAPIVRTVVVQSALITVCVAALIEGRTGHERSIPLGLLLFFWHWERVMMYHIDYKDGLVPEDISLSQYLVVFVTPCAIPAWNWGVTIGQGYAYTANNFLCENKNKIVTSGVKILLLAAVYLSFWRSGRALLVRLFTSVGIDTFDGSIQNMIESFVSGQGQIGTTSVLATTMVELVYWTMAWGGVVHAKVGLWRILGFRTDPYFDRPWLSTNLVSCWTRFTFHYREFLVRAFYYPVFFRCFKNHKRLRIIAATMAAAAVGNLIWGHLPERMYYSGALFTNFLESFRTWPYYLLLGGGISITELYLLRRKRRQRKPWTPGPRIALDVLAAYCTIQFYAMILIFSHPTDTSTVWDLFRLFFRGLGLRL